jgi:hypothetical protein
MDPPVVHHMLICRRSSYDLSERTTPYWLHQLVFRFRPPADAGYPFVASELWLFLRVEGEDTTEFWVEVVPAKDDWDVAELVAAYGPFVVPFGPDRNTMSRAWRLRGVPFSKPGWYEFRLTCAGELMATEWVYLEE